TRWASVFRHLPYPTLFRSVVVSHRPGKRAVVRTREDDGTVRYVKIVRPGRARRLLEAIDRAEDFTGPFRTARVLAADEDTVTFRSEEHTSELQSRFDLVCR